MRVFTRLALLMAALVLLPAVPASWIARELLTRSLNLGLNPEIDAALKSGVRQTREQYERQGRDLADSLAVWVAATTGGMASLKDVTPAAAEDVMRTVADPLGPRLPGTQAALRLPNGTTRVIRSGVADTAGVALSKNAPPRTAEATQTLADRSVLMVRNPTSQTWRTDAQTISSAFQAVRGLQYLRKEILQAFWMPFVLIYAVSLLAAVLLAGWLARGFLVPVRRLVHASQELGAGNWDVRVAVKGRDEINRLGEQFNDMIQRLDAQSRHVARLEKIAGRQETALTLAHEIRNPLAAIQSTVDRMRRRYRGDDREYAAFLDERSHAVVREIGSLQKLVADFYASSRPLEPRFASVDLNALVADVAALQRDLRVELNLDPAVGTIRADEDRLRQVLMNLTSNARSAMVGRESPCLRLATGAAGERVVLEVEDNGPGIPVEDRERVFEPYQSGTEGGLGLGLALVKGIVLAHHGSVRIAEGRLGGACVHVELPRSL